ncbi:P27 family phage terminase small subunit [Halioglobus sp. Uisw_031]|uniref:P27 family phage terminase small subunit n=1 Tax=Halioglobus sp. Uisw_031 TaxID=3230977 RepID=UPI0039EA5D2C
MLFYNPVNLNERTKKQWQKFAPELVEQGLLTPLYSYPFAIACRAYGYYEHANEQVKL